MKTSKLGIALVAAGALSLAACETSNGIGGMTRGQTIGTAGGAVAGGLAGYAISGGPIGTLIGAAAGGVIGNRIGNWLEGDAHEAAAQAAARAAETGERVTWRRTGATFQTEKEGWAEPAGRSFRSSDGRTCRNIRQSATRGGETIEDTVRLCHGPDGWRAA